MSHIQLNYPFLLCWGIFGEIHRENLYLFNTLIISERSTEILRKLVFLNMFEKGQILTTFFDQTIKRGQILTKTVFLPKVSHIQLNYAFLLFWSIFGEIHRELHFLVQKWLSQKRAQKHWESFFLNKFEKGKSWWKFGFV